MNKKLLRGTDIWVSELGLGCDMLAPSYLQEKTKDPSMLIHTAIEHRVTFFDTASTYSNGQSEVLLGKILLPYRKDVIIATKGGKKNSFAAEFSKNLNFLKSLARKVLHPKVNPVKKIFGRKRSDFSVKYIESEIKNSLQRLQTDYIDIYFLHSPNLDALQNRDLFNLLRKYKKSGVLRSFGVSVYSYEELDWILSNEEVDVVQIPYNPLFENQLNESKLKKTNVGIVVREIFGKGLLTSTFLPQKGNFDIKYQHINQEAKMSNLSIEHYLLKYSLENPLIDSRLIGTTSIQHLVNNIEVINSFSQ